MSKYGGVLNTGALDGNYSGLGTSAQAYGKATGYASSARNNLIGGLGVTTDPTKSGLICNIAPISIPSLTIGKFCIKF